MSTHSKTHYDHTVSIVRDVIPRMSELRIPITPSNYAVWYEYLNDPNGALRKEMEALLNRAQPISGDELQDLYEKYLLTRDQNLNLAKTALNQLIDSLHNHLEAMEGQYGTYAEELNDIAGALSDDISAEEFNDIMDRAVQATNTALQEGAQFEQQLTTMAVEMTAVREQLARTEKQARSDNLTGLDNRLAFQEHLTALPKKAAEDSHSPCLLLIDIDHFKAVNDTHGHLIGDQVLKKVAQEIKSSVRGRDIVARFGGEEFAVLVHGTPHSGCTVVAENIRANIEKCEISLSNGGQEKTVVSVTASIGGAWFREKESVETFLDRADRSLYSSKKAGRNRVSWENRAGIS